LLIRGDGTIWCSISMFVSPVLPCQSVSAVSFESYVTEPK
jgi:hypothetical protein